MPFHVQTSSTEYIHYLYSVTDQRIYVETQNNTAGGIPAQTNSGEYYLINAAGNVVSIYNKANVNDATFYFYGADGRIGHYDTHLAKTTAYVKDYLGNTRITLTSADPANPIENVYDYLPYGDILKTHQTGQTSEKYLSTENERDLATGLDYRIARFSDPIVGRFLSVDPLAHAAPGWSPYRAFYCNPIYFIDPTGLLESTHTDEDGNVIEVKNDGDLGVYKHSGKGDEAKKNMEKNYSATNTSAGGTKMGETANWDEFVSPETGKTMTNYRIQFGKSFDPIIDRMNEKAKGMDLIEIAAESGPGGDFDIKVPYKNVGALLDGKYATSRSAGNYLAGYNAYGGTYFGVGITFDTFQKLAGALHVKGSLTNSEKMGIVLFGKSYGPAPAYGEVMYQYRMSKAGWDKAKLKN